MERLEEGFTQAASAAGLEPVDPNTGFPGGVVPAVNQDFFRDQASLYLIFVSDEDEGAKVDGAPLGYYKRLFESLKGAGNENKVSVSAITGWSSETTVGIDEVCGILDNPSHAQHGEVKEILQTRTGCVDTAATAAAADYRCRNRLSLYRVGLSDRGCDREHVRSRLLRRA